MISSVFLKPAVSVNLNLMPSIVKESSILSLVVPGMSETIAFSSFNNLFSSEDFPALGFPAIATDIPFFKTFPDLNESIKFPSSKIILFVSFLNSFLSANSTSS